MLDLIETFLVLLAVHCVCDFPLQGDFIARAKSRFAPVEGFPWWLAMGAHAVIHGGGVALVTGLWWLGPLEAAAHFVIDDTKCRGRINAEADFVLHVACKGVWLLLMVVAR